VCDSKRKRDDERKCCLKEEQRKIECAFKSGREKDNVCIQKGGGERNIKCVFQRGRERKRDSVCIKE